ncbi:MAG: hypothetical protein PHR66_02575 [Desulfuromonadaceae bacterium]|nr:hypothetical protein [Desulfuromonadaceae bacterium]
MRKVLSTIIAAGFISSMLVNSAYAGHRHIEVINPLWIPVAILSTVAAIVQAPFVYASHEYSEPRQTVVYEQRDYSGPRQSVIYEEPRHYRQDHYYERGPANHYDDERERGYESQRYRDYR